MLNDHCHRVSTHLQSINIIIIIIIIIIITSLPYLLTYLLTPRSRVLLEKLTGSTASQEIPRNFGTRSFITVLTSARHLYLSSPHNPLPVPEDPS